jgi:hypothetical protein
MIAGDESAFEGEFDLELIAVFPASRGDDGPSIAEDGAGPGFVQPDLERPGPFRGADAKAEPDRIWEYEW